MAEHGGGGTRAQGIHIIDAVTAGQGAHHQRQALVGDVRASGCTTEIDVALEQRGQGGPSRRARVAGSSNPASAVRRGSSKAVRGVRRSHRTGVFRLRGSGITSPPVLSSDGHLFRVPGRPSAGEDRWIRA